MQAGDIRATAGVHPDAIRSVERVYELWDAALGAEDVDAAAALYAEDTRLESPLVRRQGAGRRSVSSLKCGVGACPADNPPGAADSSRATGTPTAAAMSSRSAISDTGDCSSAIACGKPNAAMVASRDAASNGTPARIGRSGVVPSTCAFVHSTYGVTNTCAPSHTSTACSGVAGAAAERPLRSRPCRQCSRSACSAPRRAQ